MLHRILRSRTFRDLTDTVIVLATTGLVLFVAGTLAAQWMVHQWTMSAQIGATLVLIYAGLAIPVAAAYALPRFVRIARAVRGR